MAVLISTTLQKLLALDQQILFFLFAYEVLDQVERVQDRPALLQVTVFEVGECIGQWSAADFGKFGA